METIPLTTSSKRRIRVLEFLMGTHFVPVGLVLELGDQGACNPAYVRSVSGNSPLPETARFNELVLFDQLNIRGVRIDELVVEASYKECFRLSKSTEIEIPDSVDTPTAYAVADKILSHPFYNEKEVRVDYNPVQKLAQVAA